MVVKRCANVVADFFTKNGVESNTTDLFIYENLWETGFCFCWRDIICTFALCSWYFTLFFLAILKFMPLRPFDGHPLYLSIINKIFYLLLLKKKKKNSDH